MNHFLHMPEVAIMGLSSATMVAIVGLCRLLDGAAKLWLWLRKDTDPLDQQKKTQKEG